jgi:hypothetical protein
VAPGAELVQDPSRLIARHTHAAEFANSAEQHLLKPVPCISRKEFKIAEWRWIAREAYMSQFDMNSLRNNLDLDDLRKRVDKTMEEEKRRARLGFFIPSLIFYVVFMLICWGFALTSPLINPTFGAAIAEPKSPLLILLLLPTIGWGLSIAFHAASMALDWSKGNTQLRERAIGKAVNESIGNLLMNEISEKVKNQPVETPITISDEGEIIPATKTESKSNSSGRGI